VEIFEVAAIQAQKMIDFFIFGFRSDFLRVGSYSILESCLLVVGEVVRSCPGDMPEDTHKV